jgi:hypothetical protein
MVSIGDALDKAEEMGKKYSPTWNTISRGERYYGSSTSLESWNNQATGVAGTVNNIRDWFESSSDDTASNDWDSDENSVNEEDQESTVDPVEDAIDPTSPFPGSGGTGTDSDNSTGSTGGEADWNPTIEAWRTGDISKIKEVSQEQFEKAKDQLGNISDQAQEIVTSDGYQDAIDQPDWNPEDIIPEFPDFSGGAGGLLPDSINFDTGIEEGTDNLKQITKILVVGGLGAGVLYVLTRGGEQK